MNQGSEDKPTIQKNEVLFSSIMVQNDRFESNVAKLKTIALILVILFVVIDIVVDYLLHFEQLRPEVLIMVTNFEMHSTMCNSKLESTMMFEIVELFKITP